MFKAGSARVREGWPRGFIKLPLVPPESCRPHSLAATASPAKGKPEKLVTAEQATPSPPSFFCLNPVLGHCVRGTCPKWGQGPDITITPVSVMDMD